MGGKTYFIWSDRTGWNVGWEKYPHLDAIYASRSDLITRKDAETQDGDGELALAAPRRGKPHAGLSFRRDALAG